VIELDRVEIQCTGTSNHQRPQDTSELQRVEIQCAVASNHQRPQVTSDRARQGWDSTC